MGVTLGEPAAVVLSTLGETGIVTPEPITLIGYSIENASGVLVVHFRAGRVSSMAVQRPALHPGTPSAPDIHGITLAMSESDVAAKLGKGTLTSGQYNDTYEYETQDGLKWTYRFQRGEMRSMEVILSDAAIDAMGPAPAFTLHAGSSIDDALINGATDEQSGAENERNYLLFQHCPAGHWRETQQALRKIDDRHFDVLTLSCADGTTKKLYINITSFFGKL